MTDLIFGAYKIEDFKHVYVGFSGGKDSTALVAKLVEDGIPFEAVYLDTGWEKTDDQGRNVCWEYCKTVAEKLGFPLHLVKPKRDMVELIRGGRGMPRIGMSKWCTQELKVRPKNRFLRERHGKDLTGVADLVGVRWEESAKRAAFDYHDEESSGLVIMRPVLHWTVEDVLRQHHAAGLEVNPLYQPPYNAERVGCWPCVMARKTEIRKVAETDPARIDLIEELEAVAAESTDRETKPTFFSINSEFTPIREVVAWSKTKRGGKELEMFPPETGCLRWGLCDLPAKGGGDE